MSFIVETGGIVENANSYTDLTYADAYHLQFNPNSDWATYDNTAKQNALIQATRSVDILYGLKFASLILSNAQNLLWPRYAFYDLNNRLINSGVIPSNLKDAVCEISLKALAEEELIPNPSQKDTVQDESIAVGPIAISATYRNKGTNPQYESFGKIESILSSLFVDKKITRMYR